MLENLKLPKTIDTISNYAFANCDLLTYVVVPENVYEIRDFAFSECDDLKQIYIPKSVKILGNSFFNKGYDDDKLRKSKIYYQGTKEEWETLLSGTYNNLENIPVIYNVKNPADMHKPVQPSKPTVKKLSMHRLYNPNSGEHFYTKDTAEKNHLVSVGWKYEGIGWNAPSTSKTPVYRLYNPNAGEHHYTMKKSERDMLIKAGWNYEGIGWYSDDAKSVPLYRQYNPNAYACNHNYTKSKSENDMLVGLGWKYEGIGWYGMV